MNAVLRVLAIVAGCAGQLAAAEVPGKEPMMNDLKAMAGTWRVVEAVRDGKTLSADQTKMITLIVEETGKGIVKRGDHVGFEGQFTVNPSKSPKEIDVEQTSGGENKGNVTRGIYQIEGDSLKLCTPEPGKTDRPTEFTAKPGSGHFYRAFKREKK